MTNQQKFEELTKDLESPAVYIKLAYLFAVSAALERRVFFGNPMNPMLLNLFILFVGPPAVGKGTSMRQANKLLSPFIFYRPDGTYEIDKDTKEPKRLYTKLPDTVTFEKLVFAMAEIKKPLFVTDPNDPKKSYIYSHSSAYFFLEELASLFRRQKSDDVSRFLLNAYDGEEFLYATKNQGSAFLKNGCLNLIAGTQLDFIRKAEQDGLLGEGLFSRFIIAYAEDKRQVRFHYNELTDTQKQYLTDLQLHIKSLSTLFGRVDYAEPETFEWLEGWYKDEINRLKEYRNEKLALYFSRRKDHVIKLAAAKHFGETNNSFLIPRHCFEWAIELTRELEKPVVEIARRTGKNANFPIQEKLYKFIADRPREHAEIIREFESECDAMQILQLLMTLEGGRRIEKIEGTSSWKIVDGEDTGIQESST